MLTVGNFFDVSVTDITPPSAMYARLKYLMGAQPQKVSTPNLISDTNKEYNQKDLAGPCAPFVWVYDPGECFQKNWKTVSS